MKLFKQRKMKKELFQITKDLAQDKITEQEAQTLLLGLLGVSQQSELLFAFREWLHNKGFYRMSPGLRKRQVERFLKANYNG